MCRYQLNCYCDDFTSTGQSLAANLPDATSLHDMIKAFKSSLKVAQDQVDVLNRTQREQRNSSLCYSVRQYHIMASTFGSILSRRDRTPPDSLVLSIIRTKPISMKSK